MSLRDGSCVVATAGHGQRQDFKLLPLICQALAFKFLFVTWWQRHCNILVSQKKNIYIYIYIFETRASQLPHLPHPFSPHISLHLISALWLAHSLPFFFFFHFLSYTPFYSYILSHWYFLTIITTISTIIFRQDHGKILENL